MEDFIYSDKHFGVARLFFAIKTCPRKDEDIYLIFPNISKKPPLESILLRFAFSGEALFDEKNKNKRLIYFYGAMQLTPVLVSTLLREV